MFRRRTSWVVGAEVAVTTAVALVVTRGSGHVEARAGRKPKRGSDTSTRPKESPAPTPGAKDERREDPEQREEEEQQEEGEQEEGQREGQGTDDRGAAGEAKLSVTESKAEVKRMLNRAFPTYKSVTDANVTRFMLDMFDKRHRYTMTEKQVENLVRAHTGQWWGGGLALLTIARCGNKLKPELQRILRREKQQQLQQQQQKQQRGP